jgi:hypothetical protein
MVSAPSPGRRLPGFVAVAGVATAVLAVLAWRGIETVQRLEHYFYRLGDRQLMDMAVILAAGVAWPYAIRLTLRGSARTGWVATGSLVLVGFLWQQSLALAEKRGIDGMRDQLLRSGHSEFARTVTTRHLRPRDLIADYEQFIEAPDQEFARSKPPGNLLVYWAAARAAEALMPHVWDPPMPTDSIYVTNVYHWRLANFATLLFPLLSCSVLLPLAWLGAQLLGEKHALWPALLYLLVPSTALVPLHLDQVLYPLLACSLWSLAFAAVRAGKRAGLLLGAAVGAVAWISIFVSFSLLPALPLALAFAVAALRVEQRKRLRTLMGPLGGAAGAFLSLSLVVWTAIGYDPLERFRRAMDNHSRWKAWEESSRLPATFTNLAEFGYWLGVPLVLLFAFGILTALRRPAASDADRSWQVPVSIGTCLVLVATALFGRTLSEVNRLWIFFVPAIALVAAQALRRIAGSRTEPAIAAVAALQIGWTMVLKGFAGFPP